MTETVGGDRYRRYMTSSRWQAKRQAVLKRDGRRCRACLRNRDLHIHHATYERFGNEDLEDLVTLCESCHDALHRYQRMSGLRLQEATVIWLRVQAKKRREKPSRTQKRRAAAETNATARARVRESHTPEGWVPRHLRPGSINDGTPARSLRELGQRL